jgi:hypothetical protein
VPVAYSASMNSYLSLTGAPLRSTPLLRETRFSSAARRPAERGRLKLLPVPRAHRRAARGTGTAVHRPLYPRRAAGRAGLGGPVRAVDRPRPGRPRAGPGAGRGLAAPGTPGRQAAIRQALGQLDRQRQRLLDASLAQVIGSMNSSPATAPGPAAQRRSQAHQHPKTPSPRGPRQLGPPAGSRRAPGCAPRRPSEAGAAAHSSAGRSPRASPPEPGPLPLCRPYHISMPDPGRLRVIFLRPLNPRHRR